MPTINRCIHCLNKFHKKGMDDDHVFPKVKSEDWSFGFDQKTLPPKAQQEKMTVTLTVGEENIIFESGI